MHDAFVDERAPRQEGGTKESDESVAPQGAAGQRQKPCCCQLGAGVLRLPSPPQSCSLSTCLSAQCSRRGFSAAVPYRPWAWM